jgi:hypothetical protein
MQHNFDETDGRCTRCGTLKTQFDLAPDKSPCPYGTERQDCAQSRPCASMPWMTETLFQHG